MRPLTPKTLILQLLSAGAGQSLPVEALIQVGDLFGFKGNAVRVALARLAKDFKVESDERGQYHIHPQHNPMDQWVGEWRLGIKRMKKWNGGWLMAALPPKSETRDRGQGLKVLHRFGFREGLPGIWVRPHNLKDPLPQLRAQLYSLGLSRNVELFTADQIEGALAKRWQQQLWQISNLAKHYRGLLETLKKSQKKLVAMPLDQALVESFVLGGEVIWALARDPLLPEELCPTQALQQLTQAMLDYDRMGRNLWAKRLSDFALKNIPVRLSLVEGAAERKIS